MPYRFRTIIEPFRIHSVEPLRMTTEEQRRERIPGQSLAVALYEAGGIRSVEIGTVMFGRHADGSESPAAMDLVRMAIPRRTYTQSHVDYVIEVVLAVAARASELRGYRIVSEPPMLRHFTARFEPCA